MKKLLCVFLAILTLSFCFVLNVSAEGVKLEKYNYKNVSCYSADITDLANGNIPVEKLIEYVKSFGFDISNDTISTTSLGTIYNFTTLDTYTEKNTYFDFRTIVEKQNKLVLRSLIIHNNISESWIRKTEIRFNFWFNMARSLNITYQLDTTDINNITLLDFDAYSQNPIEPERLQNALIFLKNKEDNYQTYKAQFQFDNNQLVFIKPNKFVNNLKIVLPDIQFVEPEEMAMRANVTYSLPYVINYVKIVVNSIFTPNGALYTLAPVAIISISISVLLLGAYIIKRFSWGL